MHLRRKFRPCPAATLNFNHLKKNASLSVCSFRIKYLRSVTICDLASRTFTLPGVQKLPLWVSLVCHLLTAWTLKLPLWPSDLTDAALSGTLPFLGAQNTYRTELEGHKYAMRAMRDPQLQSVNVLIAKAQSFAASLRMVVPELNLGEIPLCALCRIVPEAQNSYEKRDTAVEEPQVSSNLNKFTQKRCFE